MTKRERAEMHIYELHNVADHVDKGSQIAQHDLRYSAEGALATLENVRGSARLIEMHLDDAISALKALIADPDRPDHPGYTKPR